VRLPSAPLLEVVFELRWQVQRTGDLFGYDAGFAAFSKSFEEVMNASGYKTHERVAASGPTFVNQVVNRFRKLEPFPLVQIGHGIFACNVSTEYEWADFRKMIAQGIQDVLKCYPDTPVTPLIPSHLELRYVDVFNEELVGDQSWQNFLAKCSKLKFSPLPYLESVTVPGGDRVNFGLRHDLKDAELGRFELQIANGVSSGKPSILMTSKVIKSNFGDLTPARTSLEPLVLKWAHAAHSVNSQFFKAFVDDALMAKFKEKKA
jgi:uncharacterized protein (TIGR04255 family)